MRFSAVFDVKKGNVMKEDSKSLDVLGIKPIADSINTVTVAAVNGTSAFLGRICSPAAEEFGLLLRDRVRGWRVKNLASIASKAEEYLKDANTKMDVQAHPRIVSNILEEGSWTEDSVVQDLWAGLLASSCTEAGDDDSNLIFINLLSQLTKMQAHILKYVCENAAIKIAPESGLILTEEFIIELDALKKIASEKDIHRLDREIDHLRDIGLIHGGFWPNTSKRIQIQPTVLALHLFVRGQGVRTSPIDYFDLKKSKTTLTEEVKNPS